MTPLPPVTLPPPPQAVFADDHIVVLDKPAGLLAVPGRGEAGADCLLARAALAWPGLLVVHRLDMATSGLIVYARHLDAQRALSLAFEKRRVDKRYEAVVAGLLQDDAGAIDLPLAADWLARPRQQVDREHGKPSLTRWQVMHRDPGAFRTRLALNPLTGRSHQLRVHLQAIGHPILGDALYASPALEAAAPRMLLHARALAFFHPADGRPVQFESPVPF